MITSRPAEAIGLGGEIGSLARRPARRCRDLVGRSARDSARAAEAVWIDGVRQPLDNHQTKLRDRYRSLERERDLPEAYRSDRDWACSTLASAAFVGTHFLMSHPLRAPLVARLGETRLSGALFAGRAC